MLKQLAMIGTLMLGSLWACQNEKVAAPASKSGTGNETQFSATTETAAGTGSAAAAGGGTAAIADDSEAAHATRARQLQELNNQINAYESQLELAQQNKVQLESTLANVQVKGATSDGGAAVGSTLAGLGEVALGVFTGNVFADAAGAASLGSAIGSGISASNTATTVSNVSGNVQKQLDSTNTQIATLKTNIARLQAQVQTLIKQGA